MSWDMLGSVLGGAGTIVGAAMQHSANKDNLKYQKERDQITMQREDTAMQRRVADMKAAGINPLLAAGTAGAAASSGPTPVADNTGETVARGAQGAAQMLNSVMLQKEMMKNQANLLKQQEMNVGADTEKKRAETANLMAGDPEQKAQAQLDKIRADTALSKQQRTTQIAGVLDTALQRYGIDKGSIEGGGGINIKVIRLGADGSKSWEETRIKNVGDLLDKLDKGTIKWADVDQALAERAGARKPEGLESTPIKQTPPEGGGRNGNGRYN